MISPVVHFDLVNPVITWGALLMQVWQLHVTATFTSMLESPIHSKTCPGPHLRHGPRSKSRRVPWTSTWVKWQVAVSKEFWTKGMHEFMATLVWSVVEIGYSRSRTGSHLVGASQAVACSQCNGRVWTQSSGAPCLSKEERRQTDSGNDSGRVDFKNVTRVCLPSYTGLV